MTLLQKEKTKVHSNLYQSYRAELEDGAKTTVYVAKYPRSVVKPRVVLFDHETRLLDWCEDNGIRDSIVGGFFLRDQGKPVGDLWLKGVQQYSIPFFKPWNGTRGALYIAKQGKLAIAPRYLLPQKPEGDLLQAGPLLVQNNRSVIRKGVDPEGFSEGADQFDDDITDGRYPRTAIGTDDNYIYAIACDGRTNNDTGLTFPEFADLLVEMGIQDALNLDGGSSATLVGNGKLLNNPRGGENCNFALFKEGRPIYSAIVFDRVKA